jgi:hypothetical protein
MTGKMSRKRKENVRNEGFGTVAGVVLPAGRWSCCRAGDAVTVGVPAAVLMVVAAVDDMASGDRGARDGTPGVWSSRAQ